MLVLRLADWWHPCTAPCPPERLCHHRRVEVTDIYIFRNKGFFSSRGFLDIEKSVLLELKGVKIIRSYRDFFQLIRDFLRINDTFCLFYMISLLFSIKSWGFIAALRFVTTKLGGFSSAIFFCASKKSVRAFCVPTQRRLKTYVLLSEFLSFMLSTNRKTSTYEHCCS